MQENQEVTPARCAELVPFATAAQARCLLALAASGGNFTRAARELGVARGTMRDAFSGAKVRAARRGFAPDHGWQAPATARTEPVGTVPVGFKVKGVSDLVDDDGNRKQAWIKSTESPVENAHEPVPVGFLPREISEGKDGQGNIFARWTRYAPGEADRLASLLEAVKSACAEMAGAAGIVLPPQGELDSDTLAVYGLGDPHVGMLSWGPETGQDFDLKIADEMTSAVVRQLVYSAPPSETALLVLVGDNFHADDDRQVTPGHGHKLDVDSRSAKVFRVGCQLWRKQITCMLGKHKRVLVNITRGNHDPMTSFFMREWLAAVFENDPRVEILDNVREHQYLLFGGVLLGITHGHKTKPEGLAGVMAADVPEMWAAATAERHWITGHIHSKTHWDFRGCSLETLRTLAPSDAYAAGAGYRSAADSIVITYHRLFGQISRQIVTPRRAGIIVPRHEIGVKLS